MNPGGTFTLPMLLLLGTNLAAQTATQAMPAAAANSATGNPAKPRNEFLQGWMLELLHADRDAAIKSYQQAMRASNLPNFQAELATLRMWESSWKPTDRAAYREAARQRGLLTRDVLSFRGTGYFLRSIEVDKFRKALASGDADELDRLRDGLAASVQRSASWLRNPRSLVAGELVNFRGETEQIDSEFEALKRQYKQAKDDHDNRKASEVWGRIQKHRRAKRITASRRVNGKRWSEMTRLHLEGHHERASGMEKRLPRGRQRFTATSLIGQIRKWNATRQASRSKIVLERLDAQFQRDVLITEERTALRALRQRMEQLIAAKQHEHALVLAARTPYRDRLFSSR